MTAGSARCCECHMLVGLCFRAAWFGASSPRRMAQAPPGTACVVLGQQDIPGAGDALCQGCAGVLPLWPQWGLQKKYLKKSFVFCLIAQLQTL